MNECDGAIKEAGVAVLTVGDLRMSVTQKGQGEDVVLVAGLADDIASWAGQIDDLANSYRVTAFDNRGVGATRAPGGAMSISQFADDVVALMDVLGIESGHLVGSSMGGAIVQEIALMRPERVRSLTLFATWCRSDGVFRAAIESMAEAVVTLRPGPFWRGVFAWCLSPATYATQDVETWVETAASITGGQTPDEFVRQAKALLAFDSTDRISSITLPALVVWGADDILVGERHAARLMARLPNAQAVEIVDGAHSAHAEQPEQFNSCLRSFWDALRREDSATDRSI